MDPSRPRKHPDYPSSYYTDPPESDTSDRDRFPPRRHKTTTQVAESTIQESGRSVLSELLPRKRRQWMAGKRAKQKVLADPAMKEALAGGPLPRIAYIPDHNTLSYLDATEGSLNT
ncbi:hypothetical protein OPT61_g3120 [Boeremia exigua]|uniref:Uncharacterized protein n=1 Tax=Boeremia exigua TaxID=749465 RepID=A0ACC2IJ58_9PLEO|nr:hypothetical protein OPT61_g3120 [Boeremia exigua]